MDDLALFTVIDTNFIENINLDKEIQDFPKIEYKNGSATLIWYSEIFGFSINLTRN